MPSDLVKKLLYGSGALSLYHRLRNRNTLTVVMFHRVLAPDDPRSASCDPDYTVSDALLAQCLRFFHRHYHVVSLDEVRRARRHGTPLPPRALLVTFDDGWADNVDYALPKLREADAPGVMFVVADAVGRAQPFYQERIVAAWRRGTLTVRQLADALRLAGAADAPLAPDDAIATLRELIAVLENLDEAARERALASLTHAFDDGLTHMVSREQLGELRDGGVAIGVHGRTHTPITRAADVDDELYGARAAIAACVDEAEEPTAMSFPHGAYDDAIARRAHEAGFDLLFTSVPALNPVRPRVGWLLGRVGFETDTVVDARGEFRPDWLALYLFRRAHRRLAPG